MVRIGPSQGDKRSAERPNWFQITAVQPSNEIFNCLVAVSHARNYDELLYSSVAGFIYIQNVNVDVSITTSVPEQGARVGRACAGAGRGDSDISGALAWNSAGKHAADRLNRDSEPLLGRIVGDEVVEDVFDESLGEVLTVGVIQVWCNAPVVFVECDLPRLFLTVDCQGVSSCSQNSQLREMLLGKRPLNVSPLSQLLNPLRVPALHPSETKRLPQPYR